MRTLLINGFNLLYVFLGIFAMFTGHIAWPLLAFWLLFAFGNGTAGHRYFGHDSFSVSKPMHWFLALWTTISAYSTPLYWSAQHKHHHRHADDPEDIHSPHNGIWYSLFLWPFVRSRIEAIYQERATVVNHARAMKDPAIRFFGANYVIVNCIFLAVLYSINPEWVLYGAMAHVIEHLRFAFLNCAGHLDWIPFNYRNHDIKDRSQNNYIMGFLTLGFAWHNNHHADPKKLVVTEKWWELDLEGWLGVLLSKF
jgi:stearoyl-CoA desaturase (delta-9 desaturase)